MAADRELKVATRGDLELVLTREFDAPRDLVFEAHTSCEHMSKWWGPRRYEVESCEIDFREGGKWRMAHRSSDGGPEFGFHGEYLEIARPEKITWTFEFEGAPGHVAVETVTLEEHDGVTLLTAVSRADSKESLKATVESGMEDGARETYERLQEHLDEMKVQAAS
ncbi:MAG: SRPBCC family protein [Actinomycetota bacterium]|jgi:uncharacterized protein YndB with AHSA1/START domain